jgi:purine nucleosidase
MGDTIPVLLDTDPGSDIDDALAIAYLLRQPLCELVGISTVSGDKPEQRAELAAAICEDFGRPDVPVYAGVPGPLVPGYGPGQPHCPQHAVLRGRKTRTFRAGDSIEFMRKTILDRPGEITLLSIGPMTNVALLFALDPTIPSKLRQLVLMAGVFTGEGEWRFGPGHREWNVLCDPPAGAAVYAARPAKHTSIGIDVTSCCRLNADEARQRLGAVPGMQLVVEMAEVWFSRSREVTFHDPLAAATIFEPDLCTYVEGSVRVEVISPPLAGLTQFDRRSEVKPHRIATHVDAPRFFEHYFDVVGKANR